MVAGAADGVKQHVHDLLSRRKAELQEIAGSEEEWRGFRDLVADVHKLLRTGTLEAMLATADATVADLHVRNMWEAVSKVCDAIQKAGTDRIPIPQLQLAFTEAWGVVDMGARANLPEEIASVFEDSLFTQLKQILKLCGTPAQKLTKEPVAECPQWVSFLEHIATVAPM